ncbi:helix-turn-helix domain-containing protein [Anaerocolumna sedimenticola]|uniref:Helix-turn-helix domain-containing protein n=1 Tax=Anaerocolumna sedimenticola TaxID=2696063 RepID=A0A6P1TNK6_9FIRM|nr:AraC family transcriptional regulator [Anaerocolumna sedimenticola]QHQ61917.1 helix-turn-helix domain-containing protein [Anaerocolumna sedimenticola]
MADKQLAENTSAYAPDFERKVNGTLEEVGYSENSSVLLWVNQVNKNFPLHWHSAVEIIMPLSNTYTAIINKIDYTLREGDILIIPPGDLHELYAPLQGSRIIILFDFTLMSKQKGFSVITPVLTHPNLITPENSPEIYKEAYELLIQAKEEYMNAIPLWEASIYNLIIRLFILIGRNHMGTNTILPLAGLNKQKEYIEKMNMIYDYIDRSYMENITLENAASLAGFSKFHFSRLFKQMTSTSFYDYLTLRRIKAAESLLLNPELPIIEVALQSGFASISTFNRVFKSIKKCTPTEFKEFYRKQNHDSHASFN